MSYWSVGMFVCSCYGQADDLHVCSSLMAVASSSGPTNANRVVAALSLIISKPLSWERHHTRFGSYLEPSVLPPSRRQSAFQERHGALDLAQQARVARAALLELLERHVQA
jgi:hypothetical protein